MISDPLGRPGGTPELEPETGRARAGKKSSSPCTEGCSEVVRRGTNGLVVRLRVVVAVLALVACGHVSKRNESSAGGGSGASGGGGNGAAGAYGGGEVLDPCSSVQPPPDVPLQALRAPELTNELAVFGQPLDQEVFPEPFSQLFDSAEPEPEATRSFVVGHSSFVSGLAERVTADAEGLGLLLDCDVSGGGEESCKKNLLDFVVDRLFRGRQQLETMAELQEVFDTGVKLGGDFQSGARALLEVALQSPEFLYRAEVGRPVEGRGAEWSQPTDMEMASRLSFLLWGRGPDDALLSAAARNGLTDPADIEAQARRLLADPRARDGVLRFYRELLRATRPRHLDREPPEFTPQIAALMDQEFASFVDHATFDGPGDFAALFTPVTWINGPLASYYGISGVTGEAFQRLALDGTRYAGILTQAAWLTREVWPPFTDPSTRGWIVEAALLCQDVPAEPPAVEHPRPTMLELTTRERLAAHRSNPACAGCHQLVDPIGFAFEHIDGNGRYRETENGRDIDTTGTLTPGGESFAGPGELGQLLANSQISHECFVTQWERFAFGRVEEERNECTKAQLRAQFRDDPSVVELLVALTQTDAFRFRKAQP